MPTLTVPSRRLWLQSIRPNEPKRFLNAAQGGQSDLLAPIRGAPYLGQVGSLAAAYFAAPKLSLVLAIPPGYATAVWPPSGMALAAVLLLGNRVWPGILIGASLVNF